jgi:hypothetical protein
VNPTSGAARFRSDFLIPHVSWTMRMKATWGEEEATIGSREELDAVVLAIRRSGQPTMVFLEAESGKVLVFGVGHDESVLTFAEPDGTSFHSLGCDRPRPARAHTPRAGSPAARRSASRLGHGRACTEPRGGEHEVTRAHHRPSQQPPRQTTCRPHSGHYTSPRAAGRGRQRQRAGEGLKESSPHGERPFHPAI